MRYIDLTKIAPVIEPDWQTKAREAATLVASLLSKEERTTLTEQEPATLTEQERTALAQEDRSDVINKKSIIWKNVKPLFETASHGKCWYCESKETRSHKAVDHFRPKNRVDGCSDHEGYWWLAFVWQNYRFSCTFCNSSLTDTITKETRGKQDKFPLLDETKRVKNPSGNIADEEPMLLDPTVKGDPDLLWFEIDGAVGPAVKDVNHKNYKRADMSITIYNLKEAALKEARQRVYSEINKTMTYYNLIKDKLPAFEKHQREEIEALLKTDLEDRLKNQAEYSAAARSMTKTFKDIEWVATILAEIEKEV